MTPSRDNPLAAPWSGPFGGVPPWDQLQPERFADAFEIAIAERHREINTIADDPQTPTFDNTIAALERSGGALDRVSRLFAVARENVTTPEYQALAHEWLPRVAAALDAMYFNVPLFARIEAVHRSPRESGLAEDQMRLATLLYEAFVRNGARLGSEDKERLTGINQDLEALYADFRAKVLADENRWTILTSGDDLVGLPASVVTSATVAAGERGLDGSWVILNIRSAVDPFLTFSSRRDLRERVWRTFKQRGDNGDANDTKAIIARIVELRARRAALLGYPSHAHWHMADSMAQEPERARALLQRLWPHALLRVHDEVTEMQRVSATEGGPARIEPWDYLYYAEKIRKARYDIDQGELEPHFELNNMVAASLWAAERRFGLVFTEITGQVPVFHPDVRVWQVASGTGEPRGLFYLDNFARAGKRSGAWADAYRVQSRFDGPVTPIVSNNNNFVKALPGEPVLLSLDDVRTLFHEFGHALHDLLQQVRYPGLGRTPMDFCEFPSQLNEEWIFTEEVLGRFARHVRTGEPLPASQVEKIQRARTFNQGYATVAYLADALLDLELHTRAEPISDIAAFERKALAEIEMPVEVSPRHGLPHFDHLFGGDFYSAGYYSYIWAEVLVADAWQALLESGGPWGREMLARMRDCLLSDGNTVDRTEAYRRFRGKDPDVIALLRRRGLSG